MSQLADKPAVAFGNVSRHRNCFDARLGQEFVQLPPVGIPPRAEFEPGVQFAENGRRQQHFVSGFQQVRQRVKDNRP